ncbi:MAG TPA: hypothetical protein VIL86_06005 [Tepidisphaeraceae bacterium]|jgi:hypothetical protein
MNSARWLERLSYSFIISAGVLFYEAYLRMKIGFAMSDWRTLLYLVAAMLSLSLGAAGIRQRHRPR